MDAMNVNELLDTKISDKDIIYVLRIRYLYTLDEIEPDLMQKVEVYFTTSTPYLLEQFYKCHKEYHNFMRKQVMEKEIVKMEWGEFRIKDEFDPAKEIRIFEDINGNQYVLSKNMYVMAYNQGLVRKNVVGDYGENNIISSDIPSLCTRILSISSMFAKSKSMTTVIQKIFQKDWKVDPFTSESRTKWIHCHRIYPAARRLYDIRCQNDTESTI